MSALLRAVAVDLPAGFAPATCIDVRVETPTIRTFVLKPAEDAFLRFEAGQAASLAITVGGETLVRTFSISSAPGVATLEVTVKAHPAGRVTRWMHEALLAGGIVGMRPPRGRFTLAEAVSRRIAFVSAGSGATPLMSMLRAMNQGGEPIDVAWHHTASHPDEVLFATELAEMQARHPGLSVTVALSRPVPGWFGYRGRPTRRTLSTAIPDLGSREVFCCGPAGFMEAVRLAHAAEGAPSTRFHHESFGGDPVVAALATVPVPDAERGPIYPLTVGSRTIEVGAEETILQAALRQGVVIPCGCGQGLCGTCIVKGIEGDFAMTHQGGLATDEEEEGYLLACSTRLKGPASIAL